MIANRYIVEVRPVNNTSLTSPLFEAVLGENES